MHTTAPDAPATECEQIAVLLALLPHAPATQATSVLMQHLADAGADSTTVGAAAELVWAHLRAEATRPRIDSGDPDIAVRAARGWIGWRLWQLDRRTSMTLPGPWSPRYHLVDALDAAAYAVAYRATCTVTVPELMPEWEMDLLGLSAPERERVAAQYEDEVSTRAVRMYAAAVASLDEAVAA